MFLYKHMRTVYFTLLLVLGQFLAHASSYNDSMLAYRKGYIDELLKDPRSPIKGSDVQYLEFYAPNPKYRVTASFKPSAGSQPFLINTHSGKQKPYKEYGILTFTLLDTVYTLHVYQRIDIMTQQVVKNELFVPFTDETNYTKTFGGGRYLDFKETDILQNELDLDFNKCYNPYCAFADGFSCPIPPKENYIPTTIKAGEKMFTKFSSIH
jgi:uncharacterized protein (DUF1684 family)